MSDIRFNIMQLPGFWLGALEACQDTNRDILISLLSITVRGEDITKSAEFEIWLGYKPLEKVA